MSSEISKPFMPNHGWKLSIIIYEEWIITILFYGSQFIFILYMGEKRTPLPCP